VVYDYHGFAVICAVPAAAFYCVGAYLGFGAEADAYQLMELLGGLCYLFSALGFYGVLWMQYRFPDLYSRHVAVAQAASCV
jgi:hypothetical protein